MYFPAMIVFAVLPLVWAVPAFLIGHVALAGIATYVLSRLLGLGALGALVAAVGYQLSGPVLGRSVCCPASFEVSVWTPVALVGAELAIRTGDRFIRFGAWVLAGLAVSQVMAAWIGQGAYYVLMALGAYIFFRTVMATDDRTLTKMCRLRNLFVHAGAILVIGFGIGAAGILARLDYVSRSNLAGGAYQGPNEWAAKIGGITPELIANNLMNPGLTSYPGAVVVVLALVSPFLVWRWWAFAFFSVFGLVALALATPWDTPLHLVLYAVLPRFEVLHEHRPERIGMVAFLVLPLLAGASVDHLTRTLNPKLRSRFLVIGGAVIVSTVLILHADSAAERVLWLLGALLVAGTVMLPRPAIVRMLVPACVALFVVVDLFLGFQDLVADAPYGGFHRVDLKDYYASDGAVAFLDQRADDGRGRYLGFDPSRTAMSQGQRVLYRFDFADESTGDLLVNNLGTMHGLEDVQGYNPVQPQRFTEYLAALNGRHQEYHDANVFMSGLNSPLLHMLNVHYIVVPASIPPKRIDLQTLTRELPTVFVDDDVRVLRNPHAMPRAWLVYEARQVDPGEALRLFDTNAVDPRTVALLERPVAELDLGRRQSAGHAKLTYVTPEHLRITVETDTAGLLVLSETYDPGWKAYIDGEPADVLVANHLFRAVPVPAGAHTVELRYQPESLRFGLVVSVLTFLVLVVVATVLYAKRSTGAAACGGRDAMR